MVKCTTFKNDQEIGVKYCWCECLKITDKTSMHKTDTNKMEWNATWETNVPHVLKVLSFHSFDKLASFLRHCADHVNFCWRKRYFADTTDETSRLTLWKQTA